jgi:hypothetical protein
MKKKSQIFPIILLEMRNIIKEQKITCKLTKTYLNGFCIFVVVGFQKLYNIMLKHAQTCFFFPFNISWENGEYNPLNFNGLLIVVVIGV